METARDYLVDYIKQPRCSVWMGKVIKTFLQNDFENYVYELAEDLLEISEYVVSDGDEKEIDVNNDAVILKELKHNSGVNALAENQKIKFNSQVNVVYGLNGTGKSSYFRILNEMLGGSNKTPIQSNIYSENADAVSVEMKYIYRGVERGIAWDGIKRGLPDLGSMRVFDSAYTRDLLKKRNADELVVKPYGLFIFADLISFIDKIVETANNLITLQREKKVQIDTSEMLEEIASLFRNEKIASEDIELLKDMFTTIEVDNDVLLEKQKVLANLRIGNPKDKIIILKGKIAEVEGTVKHIEKVAENYNNYVESVQKNIDSYHNLKIESDAHKKRLEILRDIPGNESKEWQAFITKGISYANEYHLSEKCPFCHQPYSSHAKDIVDAYVSFLDNEYKIELDGVEKILEGIEGEIKQWNVLVGMDKEKWEEKLFTLITDQLNEIDNSRKKLLDVVTRKKKEEISKINLSELLSSMKAYKEYLEEQVMNLSEESENKTKALQQSEDEYKKLCSDFSVKKQQDKIEELIALEAWVETKVKIVSDIQAQRKNISMLSKTAHNELLTEQLQDEFNNKLRQLGVKNIEIELLGKNNNGIQQTELTIRKNKDITNILSEGEQKATALALYLAEIYLSQNKSTIIFDDPVNSLDHRMMQAFADLLLQIDNQIIVFTHNKMFLDCFETANSKGHICKGIDSACNNNKGKHIYLYETKSESMLRKGVIVEKNIQNLNYYLSNIKKLLRNNPFLQNDEACIYLRRGVETAIDEIVFNRQTPTKLSNKNSRIHWEELKKLCNDEILIDGLREIHDRVSGGDMHNGTEREENPVEKEEIQEMYESLKNLTGRV